jgi:hypothetical protein
LDRVATIRQFATAADNLLPHRFDVLEALPDGPPIPAEALSEDHTIGIYCGTTPRKMRDHKGGYSPVEIADFAVQETVQRTPSGGRLEAYLEYVPLRGVRFRTEELQYLEEGWWASLPEVKYPALTTLTLVHLVKEAFGEVHLYLNRDRPMPLWIRAAPLDADEPVLEFAIQARSGDSMRPTNIHTEAPMDYARRWVAGVHIFFPEADSE